MVQKENAVQVVDFVLEGAGEEFFAGDFKGVAFDILGLDGDVGGAADIFAEAGDGQAALFADLLALLLGNLGVDQDEAGGGVFAGRGIDDGELPADVDLGGGKADAAGGIHGFKHVVDELAEFGRAEVSNRSAGGLKDRGAVFNDVEDHVSSCEPDLSSCRNCAGSPAASRRRTCRGGPGRGRWRPWLRR